MLHRIVFFIVFLTIGSANCINAQIKSKQNNSAIAKPQLVVGVVIDQMRPDYIYRYWNKFSEGGFKRLIREGFFCKNTHYNYVPTYTAPGHASIYTGTTPSAHGIIGNNWFDKNTKQNIYCVEDKTVKSLTPPSTEGQMSPNNLLTTTVSDELQLASNFKSKIIGIALKDRGAILPVGHTANAAYWFDGASGYFTSSSYYMNELPQWVNRFNQQQHVQQYLSKPWTTLLPVDTYTESIADDNTYEGLFPGEKKPVFPHNLPEIAKNGKNTDLIRSTPFGNSLTKDFAIETIINEQLGKTTTTDFLAVSFSSTDYIGHMYGPKSVEVEDTYLRLDKDIEALLLFIDTWVGKKNTLLFLTADHGAVDVPAYLSDLKIPSGYVNTSQLKDSIAYFLKKTYGVDSLMSSYSNQQVFLNHAGITKNRLNADLVSAGLAAYLLTQKGIANVVTAQQLESNSFTNGINLFVQNGFNLRRSGDICITYLPAWIEYTKTGTTHGSPYSYDTHVPLIWYGWTIKHGNSTKHVSIVDIAPTISALLDIPFPNGCTGLPLEDVIK